METFLLIGILLSMDGKYVDHYYAPVTEQECRKQETAKGMADVIEYKGQKFMRISSCYDMGQPV